jgi:hypothetical protein
MLSSLFGVVRCVNKVPVRDVRVVPGLHMVAGFMMLGGFTVVLGRVFMVLGGLTMMGCALVTIHYSGFSFLNRIGRGWTSL